VLLRDTFLTHAERRFSASIFRGLGRIHPDWRVASQATSLLPSGGMSGSDGVRLRLFSRPQLRNGGFSTHCGHASRRARFPGSDI